MFTGIIEQTGVVRSVRDTLAGRALVVSCGPWDEDLAAGESVSVSGVCLTAARRAPAGWEFDVIPETLRRTTLGRLRAGDRVNLERALRAGDRISGHFVQGHIDGTGRVVEGPHDAGEYRLWIRPEPAVRPLLIPKGSVAVDGVSLTIADLLPDRFSVALIPTTLERTTLGDLRPGDAVNIETDMLVRAVVHILSAGRQGSGVTVDWLAEHGWISS